MVKVSNMAAAEQLQSEWCDFNVYRLHTPQSVNLGEAISDLSKLVDEVTALDDSTWKVWSTADVLHTDYGNRLFALSETGSQRVDSIAVSCPSYLRAHTSSEDGTTFTVVSREDDAVQNVMGILAHTYKDVESLDPHDFLRQNGSLGINTARLLDRDQNCYVYNWSDRKRPTLNKLMAKEKKNNQRLTTLIAHVDIEQAPITLHTLTLYLQKRMIGLRVIFAVGLPEENEGLVVDSIFTLAERIHAGEKILQLSASGSLPYSPSGF